MTLVAAMAEKGAVRIPAATSAGKRVLVLMFEPLFIFGVGRSGLNLETRQHCCRRYTPSGAGAYYTLSVKSGQIHNSPDLCTFFPSGELLSVMRVDVNFSWNAG